jgi:hypothetical protein
MKPLKQYLTSYFTEASLHGLQYLTNGRGILEKAIWAFLIVLNITIAVVFIHTSTVTWISTPVVTSVDLTPLSNLNFPAITLCPQGIDRPAVMDRIMSLTNFADIKKLVTINANIRSVLYFIARQYSSYRIQDMYCSDMTSECVSDFRLPQYTNKSKEMFANFTNTILTECGVTQSTTTTPLETNNIRAVADKILLSDAFLNRDINLDVCAKIKEVSFRDNQVRLENGTLMKGSLQCSLNVFKLESRN